MSTELDIDAAVARTAEGTEQANTLAPHRLFHVRGRLYYKRVWNYNTARATEKFKELLPGAKVELHGQPMGTTKLDKLGPDAHLTDQGDFHFTDVPLCSHLAIKIYLAHQDGIVTLKGNENLVKRADFLLRSGQVIWRLQNLDIKVMTDAATLDLDYGDVEIAPTTDRDADIAALCDTYKTIWRGYHWIKEKTGHALGPCVVNYPVRTISYESRSQLYLLPGDTKDCDVILHEYGHFIGEEMLGGLTHPGYSYNDDATNQHGPTTKEHYESAWNEGHATFLSCAISDDPVYHDGYDSNLTMDLAKDNTKVGPHCEGSIQCALWDMHHVQKVDFKTGFWAAFSRAASKADTIFAFYDNWVAAGCPDAAKLKASLKKFNLSAGYHYKRRATYKAKGKLDPKNPVEFSTIAELYNQFGKVAGGTQAEYSEELYNRNRYVGGGAFAAGASLGAFAFVEGTSYIIPERFEIT